LNTFWGDRSDHIEIQTITSASNLKCYCDDINKALFDLFP
jgi:hypothetical protein